VHFAQRTRSFDEGVNFPDVQKCVAMSQGHLVIDLCHDAPGVPDSGHGQVNAHSQTDEAMEPVGVKI
jgi:hypothetical protein